MNVAFFFYEGVWRQDGFVSIKERNMSPGNLVEYNQSDDD